MLKLDQSTLDIWIKKFDYSLPGLLNAIKNKTSNDVFLIGAAIFDIYITEGWIKNFSRQTGDADFTIEYLGDPTEYQEICEVLKTFDYTLDVKHPYRYHPKEVQGIYAYVDLLTFTTDKEKEDAARRVMNVGDQFYFDGMEFAKLHPMQFSENIYIPNPLALVYLKLRSYYNTPERKKDLVDMIELILRIVTEDEILEDLNKIMNENTDGQVLEHLKKMCYDIELDRGGSFDLDDVEQDLKERIIDEYSLDDIKQNIAFFRRAALGV